MAFQKLFNIESPEAEVARLAQAPEGSTNHFLSTLPVITNYPTEGLVVELPDTNEDTVIIVALLDYKPAQRTEEQLADRSIQRRRLDGYFTGLVLASNHDSYPVGGYRLSIPEAQAARGRVIEPAELLAQSSKLKQS